jgi:hypothetical protein
MIHLWHGTLDLVEMFKDDLEDDVCIIFRDANSEATKVYSTKVQWTRKVASRVRAWAVQTL